MGSLIFKINIHWYYAKKNFKTFFLILNKAITKQIHVVFFIRILDDFGWLLKEASYNVCVKPHLHFLNLYIFHILLVHKLIYKWPYLNIKSKIHRLQFIIHNSIVKY